MTTCNPGDLSEIEQVLLGVLGAGLAPSSVAGDPSLRLDYLTAVSLALVRGLPREAYLVPGGATATQAFQRELTDALYGLEERKILGVGAPPADVLLTPEIEQPARSTHEPVANFDYYPKVFDRYLTGRCVDTLLRNPAVYRFIMDKYADSSEIYQKHYQEYR
jgi:hypothetical protein